MYRYSEWHKARQAKRHYRILQALNIVMMIIVITLAYVNNLQLQAIDTLLNRIMGI